MTNRRAPSSEIAPPTFEQPLHLKYRPTSLDDVIGQPDVVASIRTAFKSKTRQHTYFLLGPGGTGKTTLARIMAAGFGCASHNIVDIDAASNSGIDDMRAVTSGLRYAGFGDSPNKAYIVDECHGLSKQAWDSLLKSTEEPPAHVFFFFCSTNPAKIPGPMLTRGPQYMLNPVRGDDIFDLIRTVCVDEGGVPVSDAVLDVVVRACEGSPRQALVMLAQVMDCKTEEDAEYALQGFGETPEVIDLCRQLVKGKLRSWADVTASLKPLADLGAEGIRIQVTLYITAVLMNASSRDADHLLRVLHAFSKPCNPTDKLAPILLAFGEFID